MAIMVPDSIRDSTKSPAERNLFNRFRTELPEDCFVLHSLGLSHHSTKLWGEGDFVVLSPLGIFVIEVKGGSVSCEDGVWVHTSRNGQSYRKEEGPFEQAKTAMFAVRKEVEACEQLRGLLYGYGVLMPDEVFTQTGPEITEEALLDRRRYLEPLQSWVEQLSAFWSQEYPLKHGGRTRRHPSRKELEVIRQILRPDIRTALTLNSSLCQVEAEQIELTDQQAKTLRRIESNPRTLVSGGAGTGKTLLALDMAATRASAGERVLLLCFNRLLGEHVRQHVDTLGLQEQLTATSLHQWFLEVIRAAGLEATLGQSPASHDDYYGRHFANVCCEALIELDQQPYDRLILDEAQDLLRPWFMDAYDLSIIGGMEEGRWHIFMDPLQDLYSGAEPALLERLEDYGRAYYELTVNCRNCRPVAVSTSILSGLDVPLEDVVEGGRSEIEFYSSYSERREMLERWVRRLTEEGGISRNDLIILSRRRLGECGLGVNERVAGLRLHDLAGDGKPAKKCLRFATIHSYKGLESRAVIAWDVDELDREEHRLLHYCGLSRARSCLVCLVPESERRVYERFAEEFGRRQAEADGGP